MKNNNPLSSAELQNPNPEHTQQNISKDEQMDQIMRQMEEMKRDMQKLKQENIKITKQLQQQEPQMSMEDKQEKQMEEEKQIEIDLKDIVRTLEKMETSPWPGQILIAKLGQSNTFTDQVLISDMMQVERLIQSELNNISSQLDTFERKFKQEFKREPTYLLDYTKTKYEEVLDLSIGLCINNILLSHTVNKSPALFSSTQKLARIKEHAPYLSSKTINDFAFDYSQENTYEIAKEIRDELNKNDTPPALCNIM